MTPTLDQFHHSQNTQGEALNEKNLDTVVARFDFVGECRMVARREARR
jgi:hypothetical protein